MVNENLKDVKVGFIHDAFYDKGYGFIREISENWEKPALYFILKDSMPNLCGGKIHLFKEGGEGKSIYARDLQEPTESFLKNVDRSIFKNQRINLKCNNSNLAVINFILFNYLDDNYHTHIQTFKKIKSFLENDIESFSFESEVENYRVELKAHGFTRVGKEDKAWIAIESSNYYYGRHWDSYLMKLLPPVYREIGSDSFYATWEQIVASIEGEIGEDRYNKLKEEATEIELSIKKNIFAKYSKKEHRRLLALEMEKIITEILNEIGFKINN